MLKGVWGVPMLQVISNEEIDTDEVWSPGSKTYNLSTGSTLLHFAALEGNLGNCKYLLGRGVPVNRMNKYGETALHWAVKSGWIHVVSYLLEKGAVPNQCDADNNTQLHWAAEYNHPHLVSILVENGSSIYDCNAEGHTPLTLAVLNESLHVVKAINTLVPGTKKRCMLKKIRSWK